MKVKRAQTVGFFLCDHCSAVHIGFFRNGKLFAEAIPMDTEAVAADLLAAIAESEKRKGGSTPPHTHKH